MNSPVPPSTSSRGPAEPFQAVMITLSAAMLVLFGIVIGRFVVTAQAVEVVDDFDADFATLRAELAVVKQQLANARTEAESAQQSAERFRRTAAEQQIRADQLSARQLALQSTCRRVREDRQICLDELERHVALDRPIPADDVYRFAAQMYASWSATLQQFAEESNSIGGRAISFPRLALRDETQQAPSTTPARTAAVQPTPAGTSGPPRTRSERTLPPLPAPGAATKPSAATERRDSGVYFSPPTPRPAPKKASGFSYFPARQTGRRVTTLPSSSGITFLDTAEADDRHVRR